MAKMCSPPYHSLVLIDTITVLVQLMMSLRPKRIRVKRDWGGRQSTKAYKKRKIHLKFKYRINNQQKDRELEKNYENFVKNL